jgi:hydroxypyruvate isomerase
VPERHEPDIGEVNYPYLFGVIDEVAAQCGWDGWIGCEYKAQTRRPAGRDVRRAGLVWRV